MGNRCGFSGVSTPSKCVGHDIEERRGWGGDYEKDKEYRRRQGMRRERENGGGIREV